MFSYEKTVSIHFIDLLWLSWLFVSRYIKMVKKHGLEISQPGLEPNQGLTWQMTKRRGDMEVHKYVGQKSLRLWPCLVLCINDLYKIMGYVSYQDNRRKTWMVLRSSSPSMCCVCRSLYFYPFWVGFSL